MNEYRAKMMESVAAILEAYTSDDGDHPWQVAYSGGKDSTVVAALVFKSLLMLKPEQRKRKIYITSSNTHLDMTTYPLKKREFQKMSNVIKLFDLPIEIVELSADIKNSFQFLVLGIGYCLPQGNMNRWCTERLKIKPAEDFAKSINPSLTLLGVRSSESRNREASINKFSVSKYMGSNNTFMPIVDFTLDDVWSFLHTEKTPWGDAEEISQLYKDATGECGLRKKTAGRGEKADDPCGARTGCVICPVVTIDKSTKELAKKYPWFQPFVDIRNAMIEMYQDPTNRAGYRRNGVEMFYGEGNFNIRARMKLFDMFMEAQILHEQIANQFGEEPQPIFYSDELITAIKEQWEKDARDNPYLESAEEIGLFFEERPKGARGGRWQVPGQITWNYKHK